MLTIHSLETINSHGHLSSHNVFVHIQKIASGTFEIKVKISDIEIYDFLEYGNMFFNYRLANVWSSPEILSSMKKLPKQLTKQMDVYSYGMIIWELWHLSVPFDGEIASAQEYVVKEESRPKIIQSTADLDEDGIFQSESLRDAAYSNDSNKNLVALVNGSDHSRRSKRESEELKFCDPIITVIIRKCWQQNPSERPNFYEIC
jgi:hypothetical protein